MTIREIDDDFFHTRLATSSARWFGGAPSLLIKKFKRQKDAGAVGYSRHIIAKRLFRDHDQFGLAKTAWTGVLSITRVLRSKLLAQYLTPRTSRK